jgi:hypothetical protein
MRLLSIKKNQAYYATLFALREDEPSFIKLILTEGDGDGLSDAEKASQGILSLETQSDALCDALSVNTTLVSVTVHKLRLPSEYWCALLRATQHNARCSAWSLDLSGCTTDTLQNILDTLTLNPWVHSLTLRWISSDQVDRVIDFLVRNGTIRSLELTQADLKSKHYLRLAQLTSLTSLVLKGPIFLVDGVLAFIDNTTLQSLMINNLTFRAAGIDVFILQNTLSLLSLQCVNKLPPFAAEVLLRQLMGGHIALDGCLGVADQKIKEIRCAIDVRNRFILYASLDYMKYRRRQPSLPDEVFDLICQYLVRESQPQQLAVFMKQSVYPTFYTRAIPSAEVQPPDEVSIPSSSP